MRFKLSVSFLVFLLLLQACSKSSNSSGSTPTNPTTPASFSFNTLKVNGSYNGFTYYNINSSPILQLSFTAPLSHASAGTSITLKTSTGTTVGLNLTYSGNDSILTLQPSTALSPITKYILNVPVSLQSQAGGSLQSAVSVNLITAIDSTDKFARITDSALLDLVESQTLKYFWDLGHPVSGMALERNSSGDIVTTGGTGFGVMAMITGIHRNFISRSQGLDRITKIVTFLRQKATRYHGAFPHWINGSTGATQPFSTQDDGGDIVETSYLMQGLLTARQFFNTADAGETSLRSNIDSLWLNVDWNWYRRNGLNTLYWNWSPNYDWAINLPIKGWNEALITYVLAASSPNNSIPKSTYDSGWAGNGAMRNGNSYYNTVLPLGPQLGGPLFFAHYSFMGLDPTGLSDTYANYWTQNVAHSTINYNYCVTNPLSYNGYSTACWGLTASDDNASGYSAHSPTNDLGIISPTAAISSLPYTPTESMNALRFFYYKLGDKIWGQYGFVDAFNLTNIWFASSYLAIDQGPEVVMIENYRSGLLWDLFMSCPEVKTGLTKLGFTSTH